MSNTWVSFGTVSVNLFWSLNGLHIDFFVCLLKILLKIGNTMWKTLNQILLSPGFNQLLKAVVIHCMFGVNFETSPSYFFTRKNYSLLCVITESLFSLCFDTDFLEYQALSQILQIHLFWNNPSKLIEVWGENLGSPQAFFEHEIAWAFAWLSKFLHIHDCLWMS